MSLSKTETTKISKLMRELYNARDALKEALEESRDAKQDTFDNRSEKWQESEAAETMQGEIDTLNQMIDDCEQIDLDTGDFDFETMI
jgi:flagellar biosynthesis chaperone FliJ